MEIVSLGEGHHQLNNDDRKSSMTKNVSYSKADLFGYCFISLLHIVGLLQYLLLWAGKKKRCWDLFAKEVVKHQHKWHLVCLELKLVFV